MRWELSTFNLRSAFNRPGGGFLILKDRLTFNPQH
jgi:hypothetical protein